MHAFDAELWLWKSDAAWHFLTLPEDVSDELEEEAGERRGFGSVPVEVTVGSTTWTTSVFPSKEQGAFILPVKKQVRTREGLEVGDVVAVELKVASVLA